MSISFCFRSFFYRMVISAHSQELGQQEELFPHHIVDGESGGTMRRKRRKQTANNAESGDESSEDDTSITALDRVDLEDQLLEQKLDLLKKQLEQLETGILPEFQKRMKKIEQKKADWLKMITLRYEHEVNCLERQLDKERAQFELECKERKQELKETMLADIEEQKRRADSDVHAMEISQNGHNLKPVSRKINLRRRAADPPPAVDKRRKTNGPNLLVFRLNEDDIDEDLMTLTRFSGNKTLAKRAASQLQSTSAPLSGPPPGVPSNGYAHTASSASASAGLFTRQQAVIAISGDVGGRDAAGVGERVFEARIDQAGHRLYYEKRWYSEGQAVFIETKEPETGNNGSANNARRPGVIASVLGQEVVIKLQGSNQRLKVTVRQLNLGRYTIRKRAA